jgi:hypothetical protein
VDVLCIVNIGEKKMTKNELFITIIWGIVALILGIFTFYICLEMIIMGIQYGDILSIISGIPLSIITFGLLCEDLFML